MPLPIVLAHGIARFDFLTQKLRDLGIVSDNDRLHYFRNIKTFLESNGFVVFHSNVSFAAAVDQRAAELASRVREIVRMGHPKVHIIAHSMGGLDARHMIVDQPGMADKVASLTTIGTPHLGTSFADWGLRNGGHRIIKAFEPILDLKGFEDLSTGACDLFNKRAVDQEATNPVNYSTYSSHQNWLRTFGPLKGPWKIIRGTEGENDGLVPVRSQQWRKELKASNGVTKPVKQNRFPEPADHLNQLGWWDWSEVLGGEFLPARYENKIQDAYLQIVRRL